MTNKAVQISDRQAMLSLLTCVGSVVAAVAVVLAVNAFNGWPVVVGAVGDVGMFLLNILDLVAAPSTVACGLLFMLSLCLLRKGFEKDPGEAAAAWRIWLSQNLGPGMLLTLLGFFVLGFFSLFSTIKGGDASMVVYSGLVTMERDQLVEQSPEVYREWAKDMGSKGVTSRRPLRSSCLALVRSTPASALYAVTVNGRPAGPDSCGWGINRMVWTEK